ncbi:MAG: hypothetical protein Q4G67_04995 [Actinomycetia bacterium]|nr:hypothetical protein [Actinomycetes bacterium]
MSTRIIATGFAAALVLTGCGGSDEPEELETTMDTQGNGDDSGDAGATGDGSTDGSATHTVLGAGLTLPDDLTWEETPVPRPAYDESIYVGRTADGQIACGVRLGVASQPEMDFEENREFLEGMFGDRLLSYEEDPGAPEGGTGMIARAETPHEAGDGVDLAVFRTWWSEGGTVVTSSARTEPGTEEHLCDPDAIIESLVWDGTQRPMDS